MNRFFQWMMAAILICGASVITSCSKDDEKKSENVTPAMVAGLWVTDYSESGTDGEVAWTRVVEDYQLNADGTGYYEHYLLNGQKFVAALLVRDEGAFHYTISGNTVSITDDKTSIKWTLTYVDGKLTDYDHLVFQKATADQQTLVNQLYGDWQASNSDTGKTDDSKLENVDGNVDINNGGGGVNTVR